MFLALDRAVLGDAAVSEYLSPDADGKQPMTLFALGKAATSRRSDEAVRRWSDLALCVRGL